jgi:hypothetical protein
MEEIKANFEAFLKEQLQLAADNVVFPKIAEFVKNSPTKIDDMVLPSLEPMAKEAVSKLIASIKL